LGVAVLTAGVIFLAFLMDTVFGVSRDLFDSLDCLEMSSSKKARDFFNWVNGDLVLVFELL
jgi:hypothetical protein